MSGLSQSLWILTWNLSINIGLLLIVNCSHVVTGKQLRPRAYEIFMELYCIHILCQHQHDFVLGQGLEGKDRSDGQAGNTTSFIAASIKLLQNIHHIGQYQPPILLKCFSSYSNIGEWLLYSRLHLCASPFNDKKGEADFKKLILPAVRSAPADLYDCGFIELKLKDKKPILLLIQ